MSQTSLPFVRGYSWFPLIGAEEGLYHELIGNSVSFQLVAGSLGFLSSFNV